MHDTAILINLIIAVAYLMISGLIVSGLLAAGQLGRRNPLATATGAIFGSCGLGHLVHAEHLLLGTTSIDWHLVVVDAATAVIAVTYLSLRRFYPRLLNRTALFPDTVEAAAVERVLADERLFAAAFDEAAIGMTLIDVDDRFMQVNTAFATLVGRSAHDLAGCPWDLITHPDDIAGNRELTRKLLAGRLTTYRVETRYLRPDGEVMPALLSVSLVRNTDGTPRHLIGQVLDRSALVAASAAAADALVRFSTIFDASPIGKAVIDADGRIEQVNPAFTALVGAVPLGVDLTAAFVADDAEAVRQALREGAVVDVRPALGDRVAELHAAALPGDGGARIVQVLDVTEERVREDLLRHMADHEPMTGLLNRRRLDEEVRAALVESDESRRPGALLLMDMDGFKLVNDTLGHAAGDELIRSSATLVRGLVRRGDHVARLGGDEFAVLLRDTSLAEATGVADAIVAGLHQRLTTPIGPAPVTASVGVAPFGRELGLTSDELLARADAAMYDAKRAGGDRSAVYDPSTGTREGMSHRRRWAARLRNAIADDRLVVLAQPIVGMDGDDRGRRWFELLLRYRDADGTLIGPTTFLPVAEETDLVIALDRWVLDQAMTVLRDRPDVRLAVNMSARTFGDASLPAHLHALGVEDLPRGSLALELTETAALGRPETVAANARWVRQRGVVLALDDFGAGFATYSHLRNMAVDVLKIDGSFITRLPLSPTDQRIVESIVGLADGLGLSVVAEHVESAEALAWLRTAGVRYGQGNLLGIPRPLEELDELHPAPTG